MSSGTEDVYGPSGTGPDREGAGGPGRTAASPFDAGRMRVAIMTREYPPEVYGGAGVHVEHLVRQLAKLSDVTVHCMGARRIDAIAHEPDPMLYAANSALQMMSAQLRMADAAEGADIVHSHTWYAGLAGHLAAMLYGVPHVLTAHSLEPRRPWKAEQLGGGYRLSSWSEHNAMHYADAIIAVSAGMRRDVLAAYPEVDPERVHVVHNGIDADVWFPGGPRTDARDLLGELGVDRTRPIVSFVGRITRQKGVPHLLAAARAFEPAVQLVLCAGAADTRELADEVSALVAELAAERGGVFWVQEMLPVEMVRQILAAATVAVCSSIYEPLGIVNLEAMACGTAVVASAVGGIPEVVDDGVTGLLVPYDGADPAGFEAGLAAAVNELVCDPGRAAAMGEAGRARAVAEFGWDTIAEQTLALYERLRK